MSDALEQRSITDGQWVLMPAEEAQTQTPAQGKSPLLWFLVWAGEQDCPPSITQACLRLHKDPPAWPGVSMVFQTQPTPGFVLRIQAEWSPKTTAQEQALFEKLIWEINRAKGLA
ncbi:MAG TPA: hypothetical protein VFV57_12620 [Limnobacter sp.]|nr:hypothetical protein [Limnobacter sp.]